MSDNRVIFLPLGGAGEIGMNMYLYGYGRRGAERFIMVDSGVMFPDMETSPGVNLILPDFSWAVERRRNIDGLFLTHGHEDHLGAVAYILEQMDIPVFARPFTAELARRKLVELDLDGRSLDVVRPDQPVVEAGPFSVEFLPVSHSVPESSALVIEVGGTRIIHTGDLKLDRDPVIGSAFNPELWSRAAEGGVRMLACDSTNIFSDQPGRSESSVGPHLKALFQETGGLIAATTFASNLARLYQLAEAAVASGRSVVLLGRAMERLTEIGRSTGICDRLPGSIDLDQARRMPRDKLVLLTTGSQGEMRAATTQLAHGKFRGFELHGGDTVLFSSKTIPGNENAVARVINGLVARGVEVIDENAGQYHVSGHANRPDLKQIYELVRPDCVVPMHGERRHLVEHVRFARECGLKAGLVPNGTIFDVGRLKRAEGEDVDSGRLYLDGTELISSRSGIVRQRLKMARTGLVVASVLIGNRPNSRIRAKIRMFGMPDESGSADPDELAEEIEDQLDQLRRRGRSAGNDTHKFVERLVRDHMNRNIGKSPVIDVIIHEKT